MSDDARGVPGAVQGSMGAPGPAPTDLDQLADQVPPAPGPRPGPPDPPGLHEAAPAGPARPAPAASYGRVDPDGTVFVQTTAGERSVGQVPGVPAAEALAFFVRRYEALEVEVALLERRVAARALGPDDATSALRTVRAAVSDAHAVGDLEGLLARLDRLAAFVGEQRSARRAERARQNEEARQAKEQYVAEAERLAMGTDWRSGVARFRQLLDEWKQLPRLDRATDDALWRRFSSARTTYTRRRKAQFAQQAEHREQARVTKEQILTQAEVLQNSTDWGPTTGAFRDLMSRWKTAGPAPRNVDEQLWRRFRDAQDTFFAAKNAAQGAQDAAFRANQQAKEALLAEGETLLPVRDPRAARIAFRDLLSRWAAIGKVPREAVRPLETRLQRIEAAVSAAEQERWRRTNPAARARAEETASKLASQIAEQEERAQRAETRGDTRTAAQAREAAATYRTWLDQAHRAIEDFTA